MIPSQKKDRVLITGVGVVNAIANDFPSFVNALRAGRSGLRSLQAFDAQGLRNPQVCEAQDFDPETVRSRNGRRPMDRSSALTLAAWCEARAMAQLAPQSVKPERGSVLMGTTLGGSLNGFAYYRALKQQHRRCPTRLRDYHLHAPGYRISIESGFTGCCTAFSSACTSSNQAVAAAVDLIHSDRADIAIVGGYDPITPISCAGFSVLRNVSPTLCRPFDRRRDGLVLGEGAAVLVLEAEKHAQQRNISPLAEVRGYGITSDAHHMTAPDVTARGPKRCFSQALEMAGVSPQQVDFVCAHGTGTLHNDAIEAKALHQLLGEDATAVPCSSVKSMIGHTLGAAGAMNIVTAIAARQGKFIPPTLNFAEAETRNPLSCSAFARDITPSMVLSNTLGFGGSNVAVVLELY